MEADAPLLNFGLKRLEDQRLIVITNRPARAGLAAYAKRWAIESFGPLARTAANVARTIGAIIGDRSGPHLATSRPEGSTSRTPASPTRASSTCS
jgi:hypothetical protein